jgi:L-lactate dehydrogenase
VIKTEAEVKDLQHTLFGDIEVGTLEDCNKADLVIITAAIRHLKPKEERKSVLEYNIALIKNIIQPIKTNPIILVVTTPIEALAYATLKLSKIPNTKIITPGTILDSQRLKYLLGKSTKTSPSNIKSLLIGEHGSGIMPIWSEIKIKGKIIPKNEKLIQDVKNVGLDIGVGKGGSSWFGIVSSIIEVTRAIVEEKNEYLTVGSYSEKYGVVVSLPTMLGRSGIRKVKEPILNSQEKVEFEKIIQNLKKEHIKVDQIIKK